MQDKNYYIAKFVCYPDIVTTEQMREMLGGIGDTKARAMLRDGFIKSFRIGGKFQIPKSNIIDFILSDNYAAFHTNYERRHSDVDEASIENNMKKLLLFCEQPQTRKNMMFLLDVRSKKTFFRLYLRPMLESGELQMTVQDQRCVSTQRYVRAKK